MPPKKVSKEDSRLGRKTRRNEIKDKNSLANVATPVGQRAHESIPEGEDKGTPQDLSPIRENLVTEAASTSANRQQESSDSSDNNSDLEGRKLNPTTVKKSAVEVRHSPITASIPFSLTMSNFNDPPLAYIIDKWLDATSASNDINLMLIANDIKTYSTFKTLDADDIYTLERITSKGTTVKLRPHHAKRVSNICEYISYLNISLKVALADDPSNWDTGDFNMWKHKGKPKSDAPIVPPPTLATGTATVQGTAPVNKQQKTDNDKLSSWRRNYAKKDYYPLLENDEFYIEWRVKMTRQIQLDG